MTDPSGTTTYYYTGESLLSQESSPEGSLTYTYDKAGNLILGYRLPPNQPSTEHGKENARSASVPVQDRLKWEQLWEQNPAKHHEKPFYCAQGNARKANYLAVLERSAGSRFKSWAAHHYSSNCLRCR